MNKNTTAKYRPSLSAEMINHMLYLAKTESPISAESMALIGILAPVQAKIQNAGIQAAYTTSPRKTLEEKLGMAHLSPAPHTLSYPGDSTLTKGFSSKEALWEHCHKQYLSNPASCTLEIIQNAKEHSYLKGLMSPEEEAEFEVEGSEDSFPVQSA